MRAVITPLNGAVDLREALRLGESPDVRLRRTAIRNRGIVPGGLLIELFAAHGAVRGERLPAREIGLREPERGARLRELLLRLFDLLIQLRCVDLGEHVAGAYDATDVGMPLPARSRQRARRSRLRAAAESCPAA